MFYKYLFFNLLILSVFEEIKTEVITINDSSNFLPVVMWHGMGDSCCNPFSMGRIQKIIEDRLPGIYVHSIKIGSNVFSDIEHGYFGSVNEEVNDACEVISNDSQLQDGFNAIGFSQGAQFIRALVQRCPSANVRNLISVGGQHQGVFGLPHCPSEPEDSRLCEFIRKMLNAAAYDKHLQHYFVQAQYWHDPLNEDDYRNHSSFLADINNEKEVNEDYKNRLLSLTNFVLVKFLRDTMVVPIESEWFGFYQKGQDEVILSMNQTQLYMQDRLGLKILNDSGKLHFLEVDGDHMRFDKEWFLEEIVDPYFGAEPL